MGYNNTMAQTLICFILRITLVAAVWAFVWRLIEPETQALRVLRAAVLVLCMLAVFAMTRIAGA
jgi:hypothetical protein